MKHELVGVITGDIVNSKNQSPEVWLLAIKKVLKRNKLDSSQYEIYRGDMFQIEIDPRIALFAAMELKASIKENKDLDVRMAIGIGAKDFNSKKITESNGAAYVRSGECFETLRKRRLAVNSPWNDFDEEMNLNLILASLTIDHWAPKTATIFKVALTNEYMNQKQISKKLKKTQSAISQGLSRAGYDEIKALLKRFRKLVETKIEHNVTRS